MPKTPAYRYKARIKRVIDGDTYEMAIDLGLRVEHTIVVRLLGVDTPEMDTKAGKAAKEYMVGLISPDDPLIVETHKDTHGKDVQTFARWVADIWLPNGKRLSTTLIKAGHAKEMIV